MSQEPAYSQALNQDKKSIGPSKKSDAWSLDGIRIGYWGLCEPYSRKNPRRATASAYAHTRTHAYPHAYTHAYTLARIHARTLARTHTQASIHARIHARTHTQASIHALTQTDICALYKSANVGFISHMRTNYGQNNIQKWKDLRNIWRAKI